MDLLAAFISFIFSTTVYASSGASLQFLPSDIKIYNGAEFRVTVILDTAGEQSAGTDTFIKYDPDKLELVDITNGPAYSTYVGERIDNQTGRGAISGIVSPGESVSGSHIFAHLYFKAKKEGDCGLAFEFSPGNRNDSNIASFGGNDLLGSALPASCRVVGKGFGESSLQINNPKPTQKFLGSFKYRIPM
jgi:hypothetical protein